MKCNLALCLRGTIDAVFILRRMQKEYNAKGKKLYMCFMDLKKAFYRVPRKILQWEMMKKGIPEILVRSVMSLNEGAKIRVRKNFYFYDELEVKVRIHQEAKQHLW